MTARTGTILLGVLRSQRRPIALWALAISAIALLYSSFYPSIGAVKFEAMMESMPPDLITAMGFEDMSSAAGYVSATVYSLLGAILTLVCAIGLGARLVAGHEEDGVLELELASPVSRGRIYAERLAVLWATVLAVVAAVTVVLFVLSLVLDLGLAVPNLLASSLGLVLFAGALGSLAFAVGAATGRRAVGLGVAAAVAVLAYMLSYIGPLIGGAWMETVSPYYWYIGAKPLINGADWAGYGMLVVLAVVVAAAGLVPFRRRDLMV